MFENVLIPAGKKCLENYSVIKVTGSDRERFMNGQLTADVKSLEVGHATFNTRLSRTGKIVSFFYYLKDSNCDYIIVENSLSEKTCDDLNKFIIMDDVELSVLKDDVYLYFGKDAIGNSVDGFDIVICNSPALVSFQDVETVEDFNEDSFELAKILTSYPEYGVTVNESNFINDTVLNEIAISYSKGCFLGQETAAKINTNRGASYYPTLLIGSSELSKGSSIEINGRKGGVVLNSTKFKDEFFNLVSLYREFRVEGLSVQVEDSNFQVKLIDFSKKLNKDFAEYYYDKGNELFQEGKDQQAIESFSFSIDLDPSYADSYESIGVILGRLEKYDEAIRYMDKLLKVDEKSVMAHTNKSLYLMKLGKIEEAEEEKSKATLKTFEKLGDEAKTKKAKEEALKKEEEDILRRESMFKQVLEIDDEDVLANFGLGDIAYSRKQFDMAIDQMNKVIRIDESYSNAYRVLGFSLIELGRTEEAKEVLLKGVSIASKKGEMMPANDMQAKLNSIG